MARTKNFDEQQILKKAMDIFWQKGYHATSVQDLVDGLCINRASMYDTYGDKHQLFLNTLKEYKEKNATYWNSIDYDNIKPLQYIQHLFNNIVLEDIDSQFKKGCYMVNAAVEMIPHDDEVVTLVEENRKLVEENIAKIIKKGQEIGEINSLSTSLEYARFLFNTIQGLKVMSKVTSDVKILEGIAKISIDTLKNKV
jgi:TetR/AcrR family transcriptional repressor of nem operon